MADTEDVAKVLFEWFTGHEYKLYHSELKLPREWLEKLQYLSERYRIGIEDARQILRNSKEENN